MSTESPEVKIAVLQMQMKNVEKKVDEGFVQINTKIDQVFLSLNNFHENMEDKYATKSEVQEIKKLATNRLFFAVGGATLFTSVVTSLVYYFISHQLK